MDKCTISEIKNNECPPIIVNFENGKLHDGAEQNLQVNIFKNEKNQTIEAVVTKHMLYLGEVHKEKDLHNNFLLIRNKRTNKIRLIAVDHATLRPQLPHRSKDVLDSSITENNKSSVFELNKQFGSKRTKRRTEQYERMKMDVENVKEQLEETVANIEIKQSDLSISQVNENDSIYRPPINRQATSKEEVYYLEDIIPENILFSLENEANSVLQDEGIENLDPFIKEYIIKLQDSSASNVVEKCQLLLYINYLIYIVTKPAKTISKKFIACPSSQDVNKFILDNFTVKSTTGRSRPVSMRDKTICHILVLLMIALDYEIDIEKLSKSVKIGIKKIQEVGRVLSFTVKGKSLILKLPLPPPLSLAAKRKRK